VNAEEQNSYVFTSHKSTSGLFVLGSVCRYLQQRWLDPSDSEQLRTVQDDFSDWKHKIKTVNKRKEARKQK
jgi:hypothetical protein